MEAGLGTLEGFVVESNAGKGLSVEILNPGTKLVVRTLRSFYKITVLDGSRHLVRAEGGIFPEPTTVRLSGATFGGSAVKLGWIVVGLRVEFGLGLRHIKSSSVLSIALERPTFEEAYQQAA
jgi:hypothetical protein